MSALRFSDRQHNSNRRWLWAVTLLVIFLSLIDVVTGGKIRTNVRAGVAWVSATLARASGDITGSGFFSSRASLEAQNRALSQQVAQYEERAAAYGVLSAENDQLRALTHLAQTTQGLTAPVISSVISSPYGTFLIGAGSSDGVVRGSLVLTSGGFVVGKVSDVGAHTSTVSEIFAAGAPVNASIRGNALSVTGSGGGNARASVPRGVIVLTGDPVTSPELRQRPLGIVGKVASSSAQARQDVYIRLPVSLGELQFVYVVSP